MPQKNKNEDGLKRTINNVEITDPLVLECGETLTKHEIIYETYGELNESRSNAVLICHALSGNHHAAGLNENGVIGWWDNYIGPGKPIDTNLFHVISITNIGSCFGSTGPATINKATGKFWGASFPALVVSDWVKSQKMLMDVLKIKTWLAVIGGSLGGMQAMEWSVLYLSLIHI